MLMQSTVFQEKSFQLILYGFEKDSLQICFSDFIQGHEQTRVVNQIIKNVLNYMKKFLNFDLNKIYIFAEGKFDFLRKFSFRHLHDLNDEHPIVIIYTDIFLLQHPKIQYKILSDLRLDIDKSLETPATTDDESEKKEDYLLTFEKDTVSQDPEFMSGWALNKGTRAGICSYARGRENKNKKAIAPIYYSWKYILENFNKFDLVQVPFIKKAFEQQEDGDLILID